MKNKICALLLITSSCINAAVSPFIQTRSQSVDSARELVGWTHLVNLFDPEIFYGVFSITPEYTQSFDSHSIAQTMFSSALQCSNTIGSFLAVTGSQYPNRNDADLLADNFGLSPTFKSIVTLNPTIKNAILDFDFYFGLEQWLNGLYFRIHAPLVYTVWNMNMCERILSEETLGYSPGYFNDSPTGVASDMLVQSFVGYIDKEQAPDLGANVTFESLKHSRISPRAKSLTRLSDIIMAFGWNFVQSDDYHFGLNLRATAPTGNRPEGRFLFEPLIGNGHHWGIGVGGTAHWQLWRDDTADNSIGIYADGNFQTLLRTHQTRVFDLKNKPLSRYMLSELLGSPAVNLYGNTVSGTALNSMAPTSQFANYFKPIANLTTMPVESSFPLQADVTLLINYTHYNWSVDVGYNYWTLLCEEIKPGDCNQLSTNANWALKGDAYVYGFVADNAVGLPPGLSPNDPVALSATESMATINAGTNTPTGALFEPSQMLNPNVDNARYAMATMTDDTDQIMVAPGLPADPTPSDQVNQQETSVNPILIGDTDIDFDGARAAGSSQKLFIHFNYTVNDYCGFTPYIGIGGKVEFARHLKTDCCATVCDGCIDTNVSEWGVWLKGGCAF